MPRAVSSLSGLKQLKNEEPEFFLLIYVAVTNKLKVRTVAVSDFVCVC
jgi:hypothetical protein